jgi:hypothetical protein
MSTILSFVSSRLNISTEEYMCLCDFLFSELLLDFSWGTRKFFFKSSLAEDMDDIPGTQNQ